jgi:hypothetical protein
MSDQPPVTDSTKDEWSRCIYEAAQETARHNDVIIFEVAAIVWSANTLLMGFILEVDPEPKRQAVVVAAALVGLVLTLYVPYVLWLVKPGQMIALRLSQHIEKSSNLPKILQLHTRIHQRYKKHGNRYAVCTITIVFLLAWIYILLRALFAVLQMRVSFFS